MIIKYIVFVTSLCALLILTNSCKKDENQIETGTVTDIDGNIYKTVKIGEQWWMAENLKVTRYRNGNPVPNVSDSVEWKNIRSGAYCDYANDPENAVTYGHLYNWYVASDTINKIAPEGWHVATQHDWGILQSFIEPNEGWKLKEKGFSHWSNCNEKATNSYEFRALPAGYRRNNTIPGSVGMFFNKGKHAEWWSPEEGFAVGTGHSSSVICSGDGLYTCDLSKNNGFSIRCVKD